MPAAPGSSGSGERADLLAAFAEQEMTIVDEVELQPQPPGAATTRGAAPAAAESATATLELEVGGEEEAVVLLEQDGFYSWHFPSHAAAAQPPGPERRRGTSAGRVARFDLEFHRTAPPAAAGRPRGLVKDFVMAQARAIVLKFAARAAVGAAMPLLERNVRRGLIVMDSNEPQKWRLVENSSGIALPADRPARLLLFVHGTFSSTIGSFGALGATPWGRAFLEAARANYDAVIGFDHPTLSEDPLANARDLLARLRLDAMQQPVQVDAISYSRGGLVLRSLFEHLLPAAQAKVEIGRTIFVGVVNGGTLLAKPENWHTLIDLYTNLAAAACRVLALFPQVAIGAVFARELVQGVGAFAKYLATEAVTSGGIPGLAAMDPAGPFIREINQTQPGQSTPAACQFYAIVSEFSPKLALQSGSGLPGQLLLALANGLVDRLMNEANDLVVNTASMTAIDPHAGAFIKDSLDFGANGVTYHTNYFLQPQTVNALTRWLELRAPEAAAGWRARDFTSFGTASHTEIPARVDTDILVVRGEELATDAVEEIRAASPSFVVTERLYQGETLRYAYPAEEAIGRITDSLQWHGTGPSLKEALDLHEYQASPTADVRDLTRTAPAPSPHPTRGRVVVTEGERVLGVVPEEQTKALSVEELVALASKTAAPASTADRILTRRSLPTFAQPSTSAMMRGGAPIADAAPPPPPPPAAPPKVTCHFCAAMEEEVELAKTATVEVTLSREEIRKLKPLASAGGSGDVDPTRKIIVQLLPKVGFEAVDATRAELDLPPAGKPEHLFFDVQPTDEGEGEIWIVIRQGQVPLVNLILRPRIVQQRRRGAGRINAPATTPEAPPLSEPLHQLSIFERRNGAEISYQFIFDSPSLNVKSVYNSESIPGDRNSYVNELYREIEQRWIGSGEDAAAFNEDLRAFGGDLWDQLFPAGLQAELWQHRDSIRSIMVFSEEPFIPWELVHMKEPGKRLGADPIFLAQKGLVRWLHNFGWPPQQLLLRRGRCRYVIPDYPHPDYHLPEALAEATFLQSKFQATPVAPDVGAVRSLLGEGGAFDLLHFAGHGVAEHQNIAHAQLMLQGRVDGGNYVPAYLSATTVEQFAQLEDSAGRRPIVVLNACQAGRAGYKLSGIGGFARAFLKGNAGVFIGALWMVGDRPARTFTEKFYAQLLVGDQLAEAAIAAREAARRAGEATWLAYVIYGHPHATVQQ